jgi:lipoprotein-anchoring transpeptidase ErfK/SrfK
MNAEGTDPSARYGSTLVVKSAAVAALAIAAVLATVIGFVVFTGDDDAQRGTEQTTPRPSGDDRAFTASEDGDAAPTTTDAGEPEYRPPAWTLIATVREDIDRYPQAGADPDGTVPATWHDRVSALPVIGQRKGWLRVRLPQRPNGSTAWVRRGDVDLTRTPYRIRVDVATMRLRLYEQGELVLDAPAGVGTDEAPTAVGEFFLTFLQEPIDDTGNWGPFVMVTSAHSETISDYQMSGDAIAAIHGPLGSAKAIGTTGAKVSHGCVRLHLDDLARLRDVPAGSPIDVIDSSSRPGAAGTSAPSTSEGATP